MTTIIDSEAALAKGLAELEAADSLIGDLVRLGAAPPLRKREPGFTGLAGIIVAQQLSTASAGAIWKRLTLALDPFGADTLAAASDDTLRAAGLSAPKIKTLRAIAAAALSGDLHLDGLADTPGDAAHRTLVSVRGIGPWTADIYLLFCLGHPDVFPAGDLALQEAARIALRLERRPDEAVMQALAQRWRPWRGIAALVLWAYYRVAKSREGIAIGNGADAPERGPDETPLPQRPSDRSPQPACHPLLAALEGADPRSTGRAGEIAAAAIAEPALLAVLVEGLLADDSLVRIRSADALEKALAARPGDLSPYGEILVREAGRAGERELRSSLALALPHAGLSAAQKRRAVALLLRQADGRDPNAGAILRANSLQGLAGFAQNDEDLKARLRKLLDTLMQEGPAAVRARARKLSKQLDKPSTKGIGAAPRASEPQPQPRREGRIAET